MSDDLYDVARQVTDEVMGEGTYAEVNRGNPDPGVQAAIDRASDPTYKIVRFHRDDSHPDHRKVIATGLTLDEAQAHCNDESTHESDDEGVIWFDGYQSE